MCTKHEGIQNIKHISNGIRKESLRTVSNETKTNKQTNKNPTLSVKPFSLDIIFRQILATNYLNS